MQWNDASEGVSGVGGRPVGVGIVGYGCGGRLFHGRVLLGVPGLRVRAVATGSAERVALARADHGPEVVVGGPDEVVTHPDVQLVVVATPNLAHGAIARHALAAGKHVVVDKPVAVTHREALHLERAAAQAGRLVVPFHNRRWDGDFRTLASLVRAGRLGPVRSLESRFEYVEDVAAGGWRADPDAAGGPLHDLGPHLVDQACELLGDPVSVRCTLATVRAGSRVPDDVALTLGHAGGTRSYLHMSLAHPTGTRFRLRGRSGEYVKRLLDPQEEQLERGLVPGDPGWAEEGGDRWGCLVPAGGPPEAVPTRTGGYERFYEAVRDAVLTGASPPVPLAAGTRACRVVDAALDAAARGTTRPL